MHQVRAGRLDYLDEGRGCLPLGHRSNKRHKSFFENTCLQASKEVQQSRTEVTLDVNASCQKVTESLQNHNRNFGNPSLGLPAMGRKEFLSAARFYGLENFVDRWCFQGVPGWIAFQFARDTPDSQKIIKSSSSKTFQKSQIPNSSSTSYSFRSLSKRFLQYHPKRLPKIDTSLSFVSQSTMNGAKQECVSLEDYSLAKRNKVYRISKVVPDGARFWDDSNTCWITRRYLIHIHSATGTVVLSRAMPERVRRRKRQFGEGFQQKHEKSSWILDKPIGQAVAEDEHSFEHEQHARPLRTTVKALRFSHLISAQRLCDIISQRSLVTKVCGALRCIRMARGSSLHNSGYRIIPNTTQKSKHSYRFLIQKVETLYLRAFKKARFLLSRFKGKRRLTIGSEHHEIASFQDAPSQSGSLCSSLSSLPFTTSFKTISDSWKVVAKANWLQRLRQDIQDDDPFHEFGYNSVIMTFSDMEFPLVLVFDEITDAEQFIRFISLLMMWRS